MCNKYEIINEGGRNRIRALRSFMVQGRQVCFNDLGGYVYDDKTLSQEGNCWIFSGSLEYPGVHVLDEAIVDMGSDLAKVANRMKACTIRGNSRIMGAVSFESGIVNVVQTPSMYEQGTYEGYAGVPYKASARPSNTRVRTKTMVWSGQGGIVSIPNAAYQVCVNKLDENGITLATTSFKTGGEGVTIDLKDSAAFVIIVRKTVAGSETEAMTPADITAANITVTSAVETYLDINNSSIVPVYNGVSSNVEHFLKINVQRGSSTMFNSYCRIECATGYVNLVYFSADFIKTNWNAALTGNVNTTISGIFRNSNVETQRSTNNYGASAGRRLFDVTDCPYFSLSDVEFPDLAAMQNSGKVFYFDRCTMPPTSALIYYDAKVNTWDNIDFTQVEPNHLGEAISSEPNTILVSSNVQGMFRLYRNMDDKVFGMLVEHLESVYDMEYGALESSYDSVIYKDCTITGKFNIFGHNVFGGTLGGKSTVTNTGEAILDINGNFRIEGNASVTDTALNGTGYFGDFAEMKNGVVEGYIYMADNAKYIPSAVANAPYLSYVVMTGNSQVLKQSSVMGRSACFELHDNATINTEMYSIGGKLIMKDNAVLDSTGTPITIIGTLELRDNAQISATFSSYGDIKIVGNFKHANGTKTVTGKLTLSDVSQVGVYNVPPMKGTW